MRRLIATCGVMLTTLTWAADPRPRLDQDPQLNNLVHDSGYKTSPLGSLGRVQEVGQGAQPMILIAGAGFDGSVYDEFMASRAERYRMFAVTLPGFGGTQAPPMPASGTSYGEQTWTRGAQTGVERLIADQKLKRPILVAHLANATQIALRLALEHPEQIAAVVLIAGQPKSVSTNPAINPDPDSLQQRVLTIDRGYAPQWFKTVTLDTWDDNNYLPGDYAQHPLRALRLWRQAASAPLPVRVRYLCEYLAQDITLELGDLRVPTLVVKPGFDDQLFVPQGRDYMNAFFHKAWSGVKVDEGSPIRMVTVDDSRAFIMYDQPQRLDHMIEGFLTDLNDDV